MVQLQILSNSDYLYKKNALIIEVTKSIEKNFKIIFFFRIQQKCNDGSWLVSLDVLLLDDIFLPF